MRLKNFLSLLRHVQIRTYQKGETLIPKGSEDGKMFFIRKGLVRCYFINDKGDEITFQLYAESNFVGNVNKIIFKEASKFTFVALEKTKVYAVDFLTFRDKIADNVQGMSLDKNFIFRQVMSQAYNRVESFVLLTPEERYEKYVEDNPKLINRAPDKYIAHVLGITPVSLSRIRARIASKK